ncbi:hypothetical protein OG21DRAFT_1508146 [Imleria badia]|nr:hypothetical protein OG21DRAFT_1508146 [Imleria badia]
MKQKALGKETTKANSDDPWSGKEWTVEETRAYVTSNPAECLVIDGFVVDATEHLGGAKVLRR